MQRVLIKCGWLVTLDPGIGDFKGGELLFRGNRIEAVGRRLDAAADEVIDATDKIVMPGLVNAHMHTWETALRGIGARMDDRRLPAAHASQSGDALSARGQLSRQPDRRAGADRRRRDHAGRLVPQHHLDRAGRARGRRPDRQRHPRRVRARHRQAADPGGRHAVHPCPASARSHRIAAQGPAGQRRRPRDAGDGDPRSGLGRLGGGRARHPHGARARPGVLVAYAPARGLRRSRRLRPHGQGGTARARPQPRARHQLRPSRPRHRRRVRRVAHVHGSGRAASPHRRHAGGGLPRRRRHAVAGHRRRAVLQRPDVPRDAGGAVVRARPRDPQQCAARQFSVPAASGAHPRGARMGDHRRRPRLHDGRQDRHAFARQEGGHRHAAGRRHQHGAGLRPGLFDRGDRRRGQCRHGDRRRHRPQAERQAHVSGRRPGAPPGASSPNPAPASCAKPATRWRPHRHEEKTHEHDSDPPRGAHRTCGDGRGSGPGPGRPAPSP